jgi:hypothetical protein
VLRIPGTAPNLRHDLVHEFAHHLEFACPAQRDVRGPFLAAQGLASGTAWFAGSEWDRIPSEQFAEAVVEVVLGPVPARRVVLRPAALAVVRRWLAGR